MKGLEIRTYIGEHPDTGKKRIVNSIFKDENLEVTFILDADGAEKWAGKLLELAQEVRGKQVIIPS